MKTIRYALLFVLASSLSFCDKSIESIEEIKDKEISITVSYLGNLFYNDTIPDIGTKLYVFHNISGVDVTSYKYNIGEGILSRRDDPKISFDEVYIIPETGEITISLDKEMEKVLIAIESNYYKKDKRAVLISEERLKSRTKTLIHKVFFLP